MVVIGALCMLAGLIGTLSIEVRETQWLLGKFIFKPLASTGFLLVAYGSFGGSSAYTHWVILALVFSWLGDVFLIGKKKMPFIIGLCCFLIAHLLFALAFWSLDVDAGRVLWVVGPVLLLALGVGRWIYPHVPAKMKMPVLFYIFAISFMVFSACLLLPSQRVVFIIPAALLFFVSDLFVARHRFIVQKPQNRLVGLPLYYMAQLLFALSIGIV